MELQLLSICVGKPRNFVITGEPEPTAFVKQAVEGPVMAHRNGLAGDALATPRQLGVDNHAVYVIPADTYAFWSGRLSRNNLAFGDLGENIVVDGPNEQTAAIGDRIAIGEVELTVIQPRIPCYKLAHFLGLPQDFPFQFLKSGRTGFYCAVTRPGVIRRGDKGRWIEAGELRISVAKFIELAHFSTDIRAITGLLDNPHIIDGWKGKIRARLAQLEKVSQRSGGDGWLEARCVRIDDEGDAIRSFHLTEPSGVLKEAGGGQFLTVRRSIDGKPVIRNYSISSPAQALDTVPDCVRISVKLERSPEGQAGAMSGALHDELRVGDTLSVRPPAGSFTLPDTASKGEVLFVSGGIGITPMLGMLWQAAAGGRQDNFRLVHVYRTGPKPPFAGELGQLTRRLANLNIELFNTGASGDGAHGLTEARGRPDWNAVLGLPGANGRLYVCGPVALIDAVVSAARSRGFDEKAIITESFGTVLPAGNGVKSRISFAKSGCSALWTPQDGSLLDLAIASDIEVGFSCRSGICGSCEAPLLAGNVSYREGFANEAVPNGHILLCSAVPEGDLMIDI